MKVIWNEKEYTIATEDSTTVRDIEKMLPLTLKMRRNGPVTDYMLGTVRENTHHGSLVTWARSFG